MKKEQYTIKTERLTLKLVGVEDAKSAFDILNQFPEITTLLPFNVPNKVEDTESFFGYVNNLETKEDFEWGIWFEEKLIGMIGLNGIVWKEFLGKRTQNSANFGYWLSPEFQGKGFMTEAAQAVLSCGFKTIGLHRIHAKHIVENSNSGNVLVKCGFQIIGESREICEFNGQWWNEKMYDLLEGNLAK